MRAHLLANPMIAALAAGGALFFSLAADAGEKGGREVIIDIGEEGDLLEQLIAMDAAKIDEMRAEFADARAEIREAIGDIAEARKDVKGVPGGGVILKIAFATARSTASIAIDEALADARAEIDRAENGLKSAKVSDGERDETEGAISTLREELDALQIALEELIEALRA